MVGSVGSERFTPASGQSHDGLVSTLDVHDELQGLEPWQRRLFACSLVERNIYPLQHYTAARRQGDENRLARQMLDECWAAVLNDDWESTPHPGQFAGLWPWWDGPGAFVARQSLGALEDLALSGEQLSLRGLACVASISANLERLPPPLGMTMPASGLDDEPTQFEDLESIRRASDPAAIASALRERSAEIARERATWAQAAGLGRDDHLDPVWTHLPRLDTACVREALEGVDDVDWRNLQHAYGHATGFATAIRNRATADTEQARRMIWGAICHQGSIYPATPAAVPFLLRLALCPDVASRDSLLALVQATAVGGDDAQSLDEVHRVLERNLALIIDAFRDPGLAHAAVAFLPALPAFAHRLIPEVVRIRDDSPSSALRVAACNLALWCAGLDAPVQQARNKLAEEEMAEALVEAIDTANLSEYARIQAVEACAALAWMST
jgi:hypothetical protein